MVFPLNVGWTMNGMRIEIGTCFVIMKINVKINT